MRADEIEVGGVYHDGKLGLRQVIAMDADLNIPGVAGGKGQSPVRYKILHAKSGESYLASADTQQTREHNCERASLAAWAKVRVPEDEVSALLDRLRATAFKPSSKQAQVVLRLEQAQGDGEHLVSLMPGEASSVGKLVAEGFVLSPSGSKLARLTSAGRALAQKLQGNLPAPSVEQVPAPRRPKM